MKKCRQALDRKRAQTLFRKSRRNASLRRWYRAVVILPLAARGQNNRANRRRRLAKVLGW
ncbi:hypothetical protein J5N58_01305 [Rhizobium cremeum]|uniref:hypothetical protein n=1 Tax=Rhizobium cremeum TaxID=2813827 RepID=UPI001FD5A48A|nr:hypothetical protein [Rhizobium cremeum]MCJ7993234.1 hypothetical protein [Rhizobium cremeum]MCJ7998299.1 hypothetical protein [Rhizobium cremeum]